MHTLKNPSAIVDPTATKPSFEGSDPWTQLESCKGGYLVPRRISELKSQFKKLRPVGARIERRDTQGFGVLAPRRAKLASPLFRIRQTLSGDKSSKDYREYLFLASSIEENNEDVNIFAPYEETNLESIHFEQYSNEKEHGIKIQENLDETNFWENTSEPAQTLELHHSAQNVLQNEPSGVQRGRIVELNANTICLMLPMINLRK